MRILLVPAALLAFAVAVVGQEFPKAEVFGGYSYGNVPLLSSRASLNGWNASTTVNIYRWLGLISDFGGQYGASATQTILLPLGAGTETEQVKENFHTFLLGPQFSYRHGKLVPFAHSGWGRHASARNSTSHALAPRSRLETRYCPGPPPWRPRRSAWGWIMASART